MPAGKRVLRGPERGSGIESAARAQCGQRRRSARSDVGGGHVAGMLDELWRAAREARALAHEVERGGTDVREGAPHPRRHRLAPDEELLELGPGLFLRRQLEPYVLEARRAAAKQQEEAPEE